MPVFWRSFGDLHRVSKGDCDNSLLLERPSPSEVVGDKPLEVREPFRTVAWSEGILCMSFKGNKEFKLILLIFNCTQLGTNF